MMTKHESSEFSRVERRLLIVTGLSGAGKSQALNLLEDIGYFCVDNLPLGLLEDFLKFCDRDDRELSKIGIGMDVRSRDDLNDFPAAFERIRSMGHGVEVLFLEADERTLHGRYRESRRPHPLEGPGGVLAMIRREREAMTPIRAYADQVIDTSSMSIHDFRRRLLQRFAPVTDPSMNVSLLSFSYRFGVPFEADLVFDVRFLPNPHFVAGLRELDGRNEQVSAYVFSHQVSIAFFEHLTAMLDFLIPQYRREGKSYLTIAIGCTGGQHRSVAVAERLYRVLARHEDIRLEIMHREVARQA